MSPPCRTRVCQVCGARTQTDLKCARCGAENVECRTCRGLGWIVVDQTIGWPYGEQVQCPDCTPENVECQCVLIDAGSYLSPPEWQQNPDCPVHPATPENVGRLPVGDIFDDALAAVVGGPDEHCPTSKDAAMIHCDCWYDNCEPCCWCGDATPDEMCDCDRCTAARTENVETSNE